VRGEPAPERTAAPQAGEGAGPSPVGATDLVATFRAAMARLAAGVCVVAVARPGRVVADVPMTATSVTPVSLEPPMVLFCVHGESRLREVLDEVDTWAVSVLDAGAAAGAEWLATPGRPAVDQLGPVGHRRGPLSGAALVTSAQAWLECRTTWIKTAGDHDVVVGEVLSAELVPGARGALVHRLGRLAALPD
jgi:flavin reductase (DIM6/NTAB) family NADH-FMN oxidoreductase RutF